MGKKGFTSLFSKLRDHGHAPPQTSTSSPSPSSSPWPWASCKHPKTHSFRGGAGAGDDFYKTANSAYFDSTESCFTNSSSEVEAESFSTASDDSAETVIRGLRSDGRLFFEPGDTSSILEATTKASFRFRLPFEESTMVMAMESHDPCHDFRMSMEEMVMTHGIKETRWLEELLVWYLRVNVKNNHGFILAAFVDLLVGIASTPEYYSFSSPSSITLEDERSESC